MFDDDSCTIPAAVARRHSELGSRLLDLSEPDLRAPSLLAGWDRLTVVCHLRYGAEASTRMTIDALAGEPVAFYPAGRAAQRPATLLPREGERPVGVVMSFVETASALDALWSTLEPDQWRVPVNEPSDNIDLGPTTLDTHVLLRLAEVEVHGTDLDITASPWSDAFVDAALPMRIRWLPTRRSNHRSADTGLEATWILRATDGASFAISASAEGVSASEESVSHDGDTEIVGTKRELLAFLLGRMPLDELSVEGNPALAAAFHQVFPPP